LAVFIQRIEADVAQGGQGYPHSLIIANEATARRLMEEIGTAINEILVTEASPGVVNQVRELVTSRLVTWSSTSPLFYRVLHTPRDSFDDFEISELLLENQPAGADIAAQILDHYYHHMVTSSAFRYRIDRFADHLAAEARRRATVKRPVRILNLHTGAGHELARLAKNAAFARAVQVTCLDNDAAALRRARHQLWKLARATTFVRADPREFVAASDWSDPPYDIIYAVNLFDQLSDRQTTKLIADCYVWLAPGGTLLFGNCQLTLPAHERILIDWLMNWKIRCRSEEGLRQIFSHTSFDPERVHFESDPPHASQMVTAIRR